MERGGVGTQYTQARGRRGPIRGVRGVARRVIVGPGGVSQLRGSDTPRPLAGLRERRAAAGERLGAYG